MTGFQVVVLWSDMLIWLLVAAGIGVGVLVAKTPPLLAAWRRVGANRVGMASATVLLAFIAIGLLDSLHFRLQLDGKPGQKASYAIEVLSVLDVLAAPLRLRNEKTYSEPFATRLYAKETIDLPGGETVRDYPRLKHGGSPSRRARGRCAGRCRAVGLPRRRAGLARLACAGGSRIGAGRAWRAGCGRTPRDGKKSGAAKPLSPGTPFC